MKDYLRMQPGTTGEPAVLIISSFEEDHIGFSRILVDCHCEAHAVRTCQQGLAILRERAVSIVICERDLPDGTWKDILQALDTLSDRPYLIVTSRLADDYLWVEVLNLGGYDVLAKPLDHKEVVRAIDSAWRNWSQRQHHRKRVMKAGNVGQH
ncbi:MAG: response regulator [Acidobacteriia bacterium]|nr:response regulator [Terriglobia bacterium]